MKTQMIVFFGLVCLAYVNAATESNDTAVLAPSGLFFRTNQTITCCNNQLIKINDLGDVKPASQKVDNQELSREDVKTKINEAVDSASDKINEAKEKVANAAKDASGIDQNMNLGV